MCITHEGAAADSVAGSEVFDDRWRHANIL